MNENKITRLSSIILLVLKELRLERRIHQAYIAENCGKTPSAWNKIEAGRTPLTIDMFFRVCSVFQVPSSHILNTAEQYSILLGQNNWAIITQELSFEEDILLKEAQLYYSSEEYKSKYSQGLVNLGCSILNTPIYNPNGVIGISEVFQFILSKVRV